MSDIARDWDDDEEEEFLPDGPDVLDRNKIAPCMTALDAAMRGWLIWRDESPADRLAKRIYSILHGLSISHDRPRMVAAIGCLRVRRHVCKGDSVLE